MVKVQATVAKLNLPSSVRVEYGGTYQEQQKSFRELPRCLLLALALVFGVLLAEFRNFSAPIAFSPAPCSRWRVSCSRYSSRRTDFNVASFMGLIMVIGIVAKNGILLLDADERARADGLGPLRCHDAGRPASAASHRDDGDGSDVRHASLAFALGAGSQMLQPLAIAVIGGLLISVVSQPHRHPGDVLPAHSSSSVGIKQLRIAECTR